MGVDPAIANMIQSIDWTKPDNVVDGLRVFSVRCRVEFSAPMVSSPLLVRQAVQSGDAVSLGDVAAELGVQLRDISDLGHNGDGDRVLPDDMLDPDATGDPGSDDEEKLTAPLVSGIASSTSVDFYGTEMSLRALKLMAVQMMGTSGVPYLPRHHNGNASIEWDEVIGRTVHAEVVPTEQAKKPFNEAESQFLLRVTVRLYADEPKVEALLRRVRREEPIGQSIGGWFTHLQVLQNEDGDIERVIVQGVELDHLAVTRAPANPDSLGIVHLRGALQASALDHRARILAQRVAEGQVVCTTPTLAERIGALQDTGVVRSIDNGDGTMTVTVHADSSERTVTPFADLPTADIDESWQWGRAEQDAVIGNPENPNWQRYRRAHIWYDPDAAEMKAGYKLPIARMFDGTLRAVFRGVSAAMAAVNGARGGVDISDEDRRKAYNHLVRYYQKFDREPPEFQASVNADALDSTGETAHDASSTDARRSAPADNDSPDPAVAGQPSEEHAMTEQDLQKMQDALRAAVSEATAPLVERVAALETAQNPTPEPAPAPEPEPVAQPDQRAIEAAEERAKAAEERAKAAEAALARANERPMRVGRSAMPSIQSGPAARSTADAIIERARTAAPSVAAVAERSVDIVTEADQPGNKVTRNQLEQTLRALFVAGENDGLITDPNHRPVWQ